jgi:hypothetical protein
MPPSHDSSEILNGVVEALGDALIRHDQQLLQDIRNIATGHEARRGAILNELQALAGSIGMVPSHEVITIQH